MTIVTLLTDFGLKDGNVGVMKGVISGIAPTVRIVDLSHLITPQNIPEASLILSRSAPYFPPGTIHVVVVDPGVGTARRPVAGRIGQQYFVGPDNGAVTMWQERVEAGGDTVQFVHLNKPQYWLPEVSHVFHGRDIFAPVAGYLASGVDLLQLGTVIDDPVRLALPGPQRLRQGWRGQVIHIDHFGNISTNLRQEAFGPYNLVTIQIRGVNINGMVLTFGERPTGELVALFGSTGNLIVAEVNGNAAARLAAQIGDEVIVDINDANDD